MRLQEIGLERRMRGPQQGIFRPETGGAVLVPFDDILIAGPDSVAHGDEGVVDRVIMAGPDALVVYPATVQRHKDALLKTRIPYILNLTLSTERYQHTRKALVWSVRDAGRMDAAGVAAHVNEYSRFAPEMHENLATVAKDCRKFGMPLIAFMYPRGEKEDGSDENFLELRRDDPMAYADLVCRGVERAVAVRANAIKTHYTGTPESFQKVVEAAQGVPLLMAGGPLRSSRDALQVAYKSRRAGAVGTSFGRNTFNSEDPAKMVIATRGIVHGGLGVDEAMFLAGIEDQVSGAG